MWKRVSDFLWGSNTAEPTESEIASAQRILIQQQAEEDLEDEEVDAATTVRSDNFTCVTKRGTITDIDDDFFLIDSVYTYPVARKPELRIGATVLYTLLKEQNRTVVTNLETVNNEDWCFEEQNVNKECGWIKRTQLCQITARNGRELTVKPLNVVIDLNVVSAEFVPVVGDWVELDLKCELDENVSDLHGKVLEIDKVRAVRPRIVEGIVNVWRTDTLTGIVNHEIHFDKGALSAGYVPAKGDRVVTEVIESNQGTCAWRSLKLIAKSTVSSNESIETALLRFNPQHKFLNNIPDIDITDNLIIASDGFNKVKQFPITVKNKRRSDVVLLAVRNDCNVPQVFATWNGFAVRNMRIVGSSQVELQVKFRPCMIGSCREVLVFVFDEGEVGRDVDCTLQGVTNSQSRVGTPGHYQRNFDRRGVGAAFNSGHNAGNLIHGTRPKQPPRFLASRIPGYPVPKMLIDYMETAIATMSCESTCDGLVKLSPALAEALSLRTYETRFHCLLHLEDIQNAVEMRRYDRDLACFIKNGDYLMLEVENLFEHRPSIIVGDRLIARDIFDAEDSAQMEGFVHRVTANHVHLKFAPSVHDRYDGEDYAITIIHNRTQFRKMHFAIESAVRNLGEEFLFPSRVTEQEPQIKLTWTPYADELHQLEERTKAIEVGEKERTAVEANQMEEHLVNGEVNNQSDIKDSGNNVTLIQSESNRIKDSAVNVSLIQMESNQNVESTDTLTRPVVSDDTCSSLKENQLKIALNELKFNNSADQSNGNISSDFSNVCDVNKTLNSSVSSNTDSDVSCNSSKENYKGTKKLTSQQVIVARLKRETAERARQKALIETTNNNRDSKEQLPSNSSAMTNTPIESKLLLTDISNRNVKKPTTRSEAKQFYLEWINKDLNYYQKEAVRNILLGQARPSPYFIFGPPGTGKTVTIIETILQLVRLIPHSRLLVATPSNSAADLIALRLVDSGRLQPGDMVRFVANRIINEDKIEPRLAPYCATGTYAREGTDVTAANVVTEKGYTIGCNSIVIGRHRITVGTCGALGSFFSMGFPRGHFTHVLIDEAGQATEPESMIPLVLIDAKQGQAILAGDPMQLGPVCLSRSAKSLGLDESFLDRVLCRFPYLRDIQGFPHTCGYDPRLVTRLIYNYRALPQMLDLPNKMFYESELRATISSVDSAEANLLRRLAEILPKGMNKNGQPPSLVFHGIDSVNYQTEDSPSWFNPDEASQVFYYVNELYRLGISAKEIGIISPYDKQVKQIRAILTEAEFELPKVGSVEEFQGQEFSVILLSTVRSSEQYLSADVKYTLGFLSHPRRVNVSLTRAKSLLLVVGNPNLLSIDVHWRTVLKYCIEKGSYIGCPLKGVLV